MLQNIFFQSVALPKISSRKFVINSEGTESEAKEIEFCFAWTDLERFAGLDSIQLLLVVLNFVCLEKEFTVKGKKKVSKTAGNSINIQVIMSHK